MNTSQTTVCVIIPAYNEEACIGDCIASIMRAKKRHALEVIVADNGSSDRTREIAEACGALVIVDAHRRVSGLRNLAASRTTADILAFVDADCIVADDWLDNAQTYFSQTDIAVWGAPPMPPSPGTWVQRAWSIVRRNPHQVQKVEWLESMNLWVRNETFHRMGGFNETLTTCEDVDFCYRAASYGDIVADSRIGAVHIGEAATVRHFARKELWRGQNNWTALSSHGWRRRELKNLLAPVVFGLLLPCSVIAQFILQNRLWLLLPVALVASPSFAVLYKVRNKRAGIADLAGLFILTQVYFFCRTASTIGGIWSKNLRNRGARCAE